MQERTGRKGQAGKDRQDRTGRIGQAEKDRQSKAGRAGTLSKIMVSVIVLIVVKLYGFGSSSSIATLVNSWQLLTVIIIFYSF
jgi:hypothetical protein